MLFPQALWPRIADGSVTVAFRRWARASVKQGGTLQTPVGVISIDELAVIDERDITPEDALRAGHVDVEAAVAALRPTGTLYRIRFHLVGDDPRVELRQRSDLTEDEVADIESALRRLPWAPDVLRLIRHHPGVVSTELAPQVGMERFPFKQKVRRLKELGLTESLPIGYRLSPRGEAVSRRLGL